MEMMEPILLFSLNPTSLAAIVVTAVTVILGLLVFSKDPGVLPNKIFLSITLMVAVWITGLLIALETHNQPQAINALRLAFAGAAMVGATLLHLAIVFPQRAKFPRSFIASTYLAAAGLVLASIGTDFMVRDIAIFPFGYQGVYGPGREIFALYFIGTTVSALGIIFYKYKKTTAEIRPQLLFFLMGAAVTVVVTTTTNLLLPIITGASFYARYGPFGMLPFVVLTTYAIIKHNLLEIRVVAAELFTFAIFLTAFIRLLISQNRQDLIFNSTILLALTVFGLLLIRAVNREVRSREKIAELASELQISNEELKKLDQAKSEFISIASHQLRAPLTVIKGYISLFLEGSFGILQDAGKEALGKVAYSAEQLVKLINDLLNLSRIEAGKINYGFAKTDFVAVVKKVVDEFRPTEAVIRSKEIIFQSSPNSVILTLDPDKMREVMVNLIDNAIKYSKKRVEIRLDRLMSAGIDTVRFSIADDGMGVAPADMQKLFTKFARTHAAQKMDPNGMGIGLYFVRRVVEDHGGKVWAESAGEGKGSTFIVELPVR